MSTILYIHASGRPASSLSHSLGQDLLAKLQTTHPGAKIVTRDVSQTTSLPTEEMITAIFTPDEARTDAQKALLKLSDALVDEILAADVLVISTPMYNFGPPASLKAWMDLIVRVGRTFKYSPTGELITLAGDRKTYIVVTSAGVPMASSADHLTPWFTTVLGFIGITDVTFLYAAGTGKPDVAPQAIASVKDQIAAL